MRNNRSTPLHVSDWVYRLHPPQTSAERISVMLHGLTGDEYSMDVFLRAIPDSYWVLSPRGPFPAPDHGYAWVAHHPGLTAPFSVFQNTAAALNSALDHWISQLQLPETRLTLLGFSQGAAMALAFALTFPERVERVACLSGFIPQSSLPGADETSLADLRVFISHGTRDKIIPIEHARNAAQWLERAGAAVTTCESDVGHRLGAPCYRGLKEFLAVSAAE